MARSGMANLIMRLREFTEAGTADYSLVGTTYWTDDQLQDVLDDTRQYFHEKLTIVPQEEGGSIVYHLYGWSERHSNVEEAASGTIYWRVEDGDGNDVGTANYTPNYRAREIRFTNDQQGSGYWVRGYSYDLNVAAHEVWTRKASHYALDFDVSTDNHDLKRSQKIKHANDMAAKFERMIKPMHSWMIRGDVY